MLTRLLLLLSLWVWQSALASDVLSTRLRPDLRVFPQYFSLAQDPQRQLYIGAIDGLLRYDGSRWRWLATPQPGAVRALLVDQRGRLWVGGDGFFGYLARDADGSERMVDISAGFGAELKGERFGDIWEIAEFGDSLFFRALRHVFRVRVDGSAQQLWRNEGRFGALTVVHDVLYLQWRTEGLRRWDGSAFQPIANTSELANPVIINLLPTADGGILIHNGSPAFWILRNDVLQTLALPFASADLPPLGNALALGKDEFIFAGSDGIARILDLPNRQVTQATIGSSYSSQIIRDQDGALMALDDDGIVRFNWPSAMTSYARSAGMSGGVVALYAQQNRLYLAGPSGAYQANWDANKPLAIAPLPWTTGEGWALLDVDGTLLFAESRRLLRIDAGVANAVSADDFYPRALKRDPVDKDLLWVGTEHGLALLRVSNNFAVIGWQRDIDWQISNLAASADGVWVGSSKGAFRARADASTAQGFAVSAVTEIPATEAHVFSAAGQTLISTASGVFALRNGQFQRDSLDGLDALLAPEERLSLVSAPDGTQWAYSFHSLYRRASSSSPWRAMVVLDQIGVVNTLLPLAHGDALIGTNRGVTHYRSALDTDLADAPTLRVEAAVFAAPGMPARRLRLDQPTPLQLGGGSLTFSLSFTDFGPGVKQYQVMLTGFSDKFSSWSNQDSYRFLALPPGEYRLRIRARRLFGQIVTGDDFAFVIVPRWYERHWVVPAAIALLIGLFALAAVQRQRTRVKRLRARNLALDAIVTARTEDLARANVQLRELAERDGLTGIANRRRFDACLRTALAQGSCGLLLIDADHFKHYNDRHGHPAGDELLKGIANVLSAHTRADTLVARYGGEEFALITQPVTDTALLELAEHLRGQIQSQLGDVTVSIGAALALPDDTPETLIERADAALYLAKKNGRNRVEAARI